METWLEVRPCAGGKAVSADGRMLEIPALAEALQAAKGAGRRGGEWEYSRRLGPEEAAQLKAAIRFGDPAEDSRSVSLAADVEYEGSCYSLVLFSMKTQ